MNRKYGLKFGDVNNTRRSLLFAKSPPGTPFCTLRNYNSQFAQHTQTKQETRYVLYFYSYHNSAFLSLNVEPKCSAKRAPTARGSKQLGLATVGATIASFVQPSSPLQTIINISTEAPSCLETNCQDGRPQCSRVCRLTCMRCSSRGGVSD